MDAAGAEVAAAGVEEEEAAAAGAACMHGSWGSTVLRRGPGVEAGDIGCGNVVPASPSLLVLMKLAASE